MLQRGTGLLELELHFSQFRTPVSNWSPSPSTSPWPEKSQDLMPFQTLTPGVSPWAKNTPWRWNCTPQPIENNSFLIVLPTAWDPGPESLHIWPQVCRALGKAYSSRVESAHFIQFVTVATSTVLYLQHHWSRKSPHLTSFQPWPQMCHTVAGIDLMSWNFVLWPIWDPSLFDCVLQPPGPGGLHFWNSFNLWP